MLNRCDYCHQEIEWLECNCTTAKAIRENKDSHNSKLESRVRELEAERDRLKEDIEIKDLEIVDFRAEVARHAALVKAG